MVLKRYFDLRKVFWNVRYETTTTLLIATAIYLLRKWEVLSVALPWSIAAILGSALAIFIAFRNQSSYGRWWEARTIWGGIINNSRIFARQIISNVNNAITTGKVEAEAGKAFQQELIYRQIAFAHSLRLHLRRQHQPEDYRHLLSDEEYAILQQSNNQPNLILLKQGSRVKEGITQEYLGAFDNISIEPNIAAFSNWQGACERIKNTPLPMNYQYFTKLFLYFFIFIIPFCLVGDFEKLQIDALLIPVSFLISFVFSIMNRVGEINENPFENDIQDIPMTALCNTIERDLMEMLGEKNLPTKVQPIDGFLY